MLLRVIHSLHNMYIGGMAKGLKYFFLKRGETHYLQIVVPTGSAAALVGGSTYNCLLGIREHKEGRVFSQTSFSQVKAHLHQCEYILLDEVSMVSCQKCMISVKGWHWVIKGCMNILERWTWYCVEILLSFSLLKQDLCLDLMLDCMSQTLQVQRNRNVP